MTPVPDISKDGHPFKEVDNPVNWNISFFFRLLFKIIKVEESINITVYQLVVYWYQKDENYQRIVNGWVLYDNG